MKCTFQVGDRVVHSWRIPDTAPPRVPGWETRPVFVLGTIYTVSAMTAYGDLVGLQFQEVPPWYAPPPDGREAYWDSREFSPVKPLSFWVGKKQELELEKQE